MDAAPFGSREHPEPLAKLVSNGRHRSFVFRGVGVSQPGRFPSRRARAVKQRKRRFALVFFRNSTSRFALKRPLGDVRGSFPKRVAAQMARPAPCGVRHLVRHVQVPHPRDCAVVRRGGVRVPCAPVGAAWRRFLRQIGFTRLIEKSAIPRGCFVPTLLLQRHGGHRARVRGQETRGGLIVGSIQRSVHGSSHRHSVLTGHHPQLK
mmetsp:Transcript_4015/g.13408  ORF Transcript_4015/g.13408 Transcript_4015/m.13408 type:complete len:206 (+) Transcript_4015:2272-2889(+)